MHENMSKPRLPLRYCPAPLRPSARAGVLNQEVSLFHPSRFRPEYWQITRGAHILLNSGLPTLMTNGNITTPIRTIAPVGNAGGVGYDEAPSP